MKRLLVLTTCAALLAGCGLMPKKKMKPYFPPQTTQAVGADAIERVPFRTGISSVTVERMAAASGCVGGQGAGLVTSPGPVEVYRMVCSNQQVYMARCEFRQCKPMAANGRG